MALSRESPRVAVNNRPALWSPDFPRFRAWHRAVSVPCSAAARPTRSLDQTIPRRIGAANYGALMTRLVALLRGINVGGIRIRMADLKEVFGGLGCENVRTVLASGNVLFDAEDDPATAKARIEPHSPSGSVTRPTPSSSSSRISHGSSRRIPSTTHAPTGIRTSCSSPIPQCSNRWSPSRTISIRTSNASTRVKVSSTGRS